MAADAFYIFYQGWLLVRMVEAKKVGARWKKVNTEAEIDPEIKLREDKKQRHKKKAESYEGWDKLLWTVIQNFTWQWQVLLLVTHQYAARLTRCLARTPEICVKLLDNDGGISYSLCSWVLFVESLEWLITLSSTRDCCWNNSANSVLWKLFF